MQTAFTRKALSHGLRSIVRNTSSAFRALSQQDDGFSRADSEVSPPPWSWGAQAVRVLSTVGHSDLPLDTGRRRLVILGSGWAAARLAKDINARLYDFTVCSGDSTLPTCQALQRQIGRLRGLQLFCRPLISVWAFVQIVSPRNHMVFTPLLASTCVGTVEPRSVALPLIDIQRELKQPQVRGYRACLTQVLSTCTCSPESPELLPVMNGTLMCQCRINTMLRR